MLQIVPNISSDEVTPSPRHPASDEITPVPIDKTDPRIRGVVNHICLGLFYDFQNFICLIRTKIQW